VGARQDKSTERLVDGRGDTARGLRPAGTGSRTVRNVVRGSGGGTPPSRAASAARGGEAPSATEVARLTGGTLGSLPQERFGAPGRRGQGRSSVARGSGRRKARTRFGLRPGRRWAGRRSRSTDRHESGGPSGRRASARGMRGHRLQASPEGLADPLLATRLRSGSRPDADGLRSGCDERGERQGRPRPARRRRGRHAPLLRQRETAARGHPPCSSQESGGPTRHDTRASARGSGDEVTETGAIDTAAQSGPEEAFRRVRAAGPKSRVTSGAFVEEPPGGRVSAREPDGDEANEATRQGNRRIVRPRGRRIRPTGRRSVVSTRLGWQARRFVTRRSSRGKPPTGRTSVPKGGGGRRLRSCGWSGHRTPECERMLRHADASGERLFGSLLAPAATAARHTCFGTGDPGWRGGRGRGTGGQAEGSDQAGTSVPVRTRQAAGSLPDGVVAADQQANGLRSGRVPASGDREAGPAYRKRRDPRSCFGAAAGGGRTGTSPGRAAARKRCSQRVSARGRRSGGAVEVERPAGTDRCWRSVLLR
jgi:hypothetical protein